MIIFTDLESTTDEASKCNRSNNNCYDMVLCNWHVSVLLGRGMGACKWTINIGR